jgi:hypothetical protein
MAAIICLATTAVAQISENQTLSTTLWKQGIATCAHYTAHARGFAKKIEEIKGKYPQGYTLDDLNEVYSNQGRKWEKIYNEFKDEEGKKIRRNEALAKNYLIGSYGGIPALKPMTMMGRGETDGIKG